MWHDGFEVRGFGFFTSLRCVQNDRGERGKHQGTLWQPGLHPLVKVFVKLGSLGAE